MAYRYVVVGSFHDAVATTLSASKTPREAKPVMKKNHHKERTVEDSTRTCAVVFVTG